MFTGIVQAVGRVAAIERGDFGARLRVDRGDWGVEVGHGDSICVSGVCLTVAEIDPPHLAFDVIAQTLSCTTLGRLESGSRVNLEASVTPSQPLGGHFMQGHVDGVAEVAEVERSAREHRIRVVPPPAMMDIIVPRGSIAIDGVSLTIASVGETDFEVALIPTTLDLTTLGGLKQGDAVNVEGDILAKTVVHHLKRQQAGGEGSAVTMQMLRDAGFA